MDLIVVIFVLAMVTQGAHSKITRSGPCYRNLHIPPTELERMTAQKYLDEMDVNRDGNITREEADAWFDKQHDIRDQFIWQRKDRNKDGVLGWYEYAMDYLDWKMMMLPRAIPYKNFEFQLFPLPEHYHRSYYDACDENGDGVLNWVEFKNCLSPERIKDKSGSKLQMWLYNVQDANKDGRIDFSEFSQAFVYYHHNNFCTHREPNNETEIFMRFNSIDRDHDGFLTPADGLAEILAAYEAPRDPSLYEACLKAKEIVPFPLASLKVEEILATDWIAKLILLAKADRSRFDALFMCG
ncbi:hypothetical protein SELMODRAFT_419239 [Selaginella moellendorffii]|uniref:EF-hand domain-containing protein n=1 Tax=Selaginella moellendorffii TaxID=88036 RepID=D8S8A5_SELML|nr:hypothetical protein SELMODRAFT_419239 [Selaginella moellendorffii]